MSYKEYEKKSRFYKMFVDNGLSISTLSLVLGFALIVSGCVMLYCHTNAPYDQAKIEAFQEGLESMDICDTDTRDTLIGYNAKVKSAQKYNQLWWGAPFIPNSWDSMKTVPIENTACYKNTERKDVNITGLEGLAEALSD